MNKKILKKILIFTLITSSNLAIANSSGVSLSIEEMKVLQISANRDRNPISQYLFSKELLSANMEDKGIQMLKNSALNERENNGLGYEKAQRDLAEYYLGKRDYKNAVFWFKKSAASGNYRSSYVLSSMFREGVGMKKDYKSAIAWMNHAARSGDSESLRALGQMYLIGLGIKKDEEKAIENFKKSISKKNHQAMLTLGIHYKINKENESEANELITKVKNEKTNFMVEYIYKTLVSGDMVNIRLMGEENNKEKRNRRGRGSESSNKNFEITKRSDRTDEKVMQYYKHLIYTFRTTEQSLKM